MREDCCPACTGPLDSPRCRSCGAAAQPGGYHVLRLISETHHGRVYLARAPTGTLVALKELVFALAPGAQRIDAFEREARLLAGLEHPAIPRFVAAFHEGEGVGLRLYLAQEYVAGVTLQQRLTLGALGEDEALRLGREVLLVLAELHGRTPRILHRDLKPQNLLLRDDGRVALVDFGSARELQGEATFGSSLAGTFGYAPLEQLGGTADARSDLYALGATLLHALTGIHPAALLLHGYELEWRQALHCSPRTARFLSRLTALRPGDRFASAEAALAALGPLLAAPPATLSVAPAAAAQPARTFLGPPRPRRTVQRGAALAAAAALHLGAIGLLAERAPEVRAATVPARAGTHILPGFLSARLAHLVAPRERTADFRGPRRLCNELPELVGDDGSAPHGGNVPVTYVVHADGHVDQVHLTDARVPAVLFLAVKSWLESCAFEPAQLPSGREPVRVRQSFRFR